MKTTDGPEEIDWIVSENPVAYPAAITWMDNRASAIAAGTAREAVWLLEHPPLYTAGTSAHPAEMRDQRFPVYAAGRGGRYTYHGPGQRIVYVLLSLDRRGRDIRKFVCEIEGWMIAALAKLGISARRELGRIGIWVDDSEIGEAKIGAIGVRVRKWVSLHGFAINGDVDLSHYDGIVPCGITDFGVTSIDRLIARYDRDALDAALKVEFDPFLAKLRLENGT